MDREEDDTVGQPESTVAQNFAADLDSMFGLSPGLATLSQTVEEKKASVSSGQSELEQLEVRLRATEERLAKVSRNSSPARQADGGAGDAPSTQRHAAQNQASPLAQQPTYPDDRPPTAPKREAPVPPQRDEGGATQGHTAGREDYVMVDRTAQSASDQ